MAGQRADAAWITITNETKVVVVVQETTGPFNRPVRGKCIKLQPGETYKELQQLGGSRNISIATAEAPNKPLHNAKLAWDKSDIGFCVQLDGKSVKLAAAAPKTDDISSTSKSPAASTIKK